MFKFFKKKKEATEHRYKVVEKKVEYHQTAIDVTLELINGKTIVYQLKSYLQRETEYTVNLITGKRVYYNDLDFKNHGKFEYTPWHVSPSPPSLTSPEIIIPDTGLVINSAHVVSIKASPEYVTQEIISDTYKQIEPI